MAVPPYAPWQRVAAGERAGDDGPRVEPNPGVADAYGVLEEFARLYRWARRTLDLHAPEVDGYELWQLAAEAGLGGMLAEEEDLLALAREEAEHAADGGRRRPEWKPGMRGGDVEDEARRLLEERAADPEVVMFPAPVPESARPAPRAPDRPGPRPVPSPQSGGRDLIAERVAALRGEAPAPTAEPSGHRLMDLWGLRPPAEEPDGGAAD